MSSKVYRLLRNNKEQGPFTSDEIIQKGLKPYDLIWIDGRSAAWSYPGELPEFKLYVPVPDEQLFDRFSKKQESSTTVSAAVQAAVAVSDNIQTVSKQPKPRYKVSAAWSKIQTITAPLYREAMVTEPVRRSSSKVPVLNAEPSFESRPLSWEDAWRDWEKEKNQVNIKPAFVVSKPVTPAQKPTINEVFGDSPVLETKYSAPLDTLKDRYIENILQQKKKSRNGFSFGKASEFVLPSIALLVILSIGYWLLHDNNKTASALSSNQLKTAEPAAATKTNELPGNLNSHTDNTGNTATTTAKHDEEPGITVSERSLAESKSEQKKNKNSFQTVKFKTAAQEQATTSNKLNETNNRATAFNNSKTPVKKVSNTENKIFDPSVINNIPRDKSYNDQISANTGDLNALDGRPVRRRTNGSGQITNKQPGTNDQKLNNQPTVSKRSNGKANLKYVNVPEYLEMNNGNGSLKIENVSDVDLDLVVVDVQYYDASSRFRKGETLYLHNLRAGKSVVVKTPRDINSMYAVSKVSLVSADSKGVYIVGDN